MNRARRSVTVYNKKATQPKVSDDDFESGDGFSDDPDDDDGDFSVSEDEWLPGKEKGDDDGGDEGLQGTTVSDDDDEEDESGSASENQDDLEEDSDESVIASANSRAKKRTSKTSANPMPKKKRLSAATRDELYQRTKKYLLKEPDPERPPLNSSVTDILKLCQFRKKKDINSSSKVASPRVERAKKKAGGGDSDSSGDDHLMKPEELDLASNFFDKIEPTKQDPADVPQFDCNAGMRLSDSSDDDDGREEPEVPASIQKMAAQQLISKINESSCDFMNFNSLGEFNKKIEEAKNMLKNYQAREGVKEERSQEKKAEDVSNLLALGETEAGISPGKGKDTAGHNETGSEESDWEEVEDAKRSQATQKPPADYQITVEVQTEKSKKKRWEEIEMELFIKRQINKVKRTNQLAFHKSSVLCAIAGGKKLNEIVNSPGIQARALSLMQSGQCVLKGKLDGKFVDQLMKWFKNKFELTSQQVFGPSSSSRFSFTLALELFTQKVACRRDYVLLFLACLRAAGVDCRLIISANVPPKRPAMKDLCPISERQLLEKFDKQFGKQSTKAPSETTEGLEVKIEKEVDVKNVQTVEEAVEEHLDDEQKNSKLEVPAKPSKETTKRKSTRKALGVTESTQTAKSSRLSLPKVQVPEEQDQEPRRGRSRSKSTTQCHRDSSSESARKIRFSPEPEICNGQPKSASTSPAKENARPRKSILKRSSPRVASSSSRMPLNSLIVPQLDGISDLVPSTPQSIPLSRRLRSRTKSTAAETSSPFSKRGTNTPTMAKEKNNNQPGRISKRKLFDISKTTPTTTKEAVPSPPTTAKPKSAKNRILSSDSSDEAAKAPTLPTLNKKRQSRGARIKSKLPPQASPSSEDSDFEPPGKKKAKRTPKARPETAGKSGSKAAATKRPKSKSAAAKDAEKEDSELTAAANKMDLWIEFYSEKDKRWITVDLFSGKINCVDYLVRHATSPISYVFGFDNANHIKDITPRYVQHWNTVSRMLRVEPKWLDKALKPFQAKKSAREKQEDEELNKIDIDKPLPTTIAECKNHPLYVLKRHLLKFEALYPPEVPSLGFVRGEAIYARECLFVLQTREKWYKQGRVVKPFETAYKMVKCWKYDKLKNEWQGNQPCEIFGKWQTEEYDPPTAENGLVPRNEYGNVELFTPKMLPKKTVHLQLPGLNRVCKRLGIDCAQALIGFDKARMRMIPVYDGFVVCEEFANQVVEEWYKEMEEEERREQEKYEKRVYGNWKRLIKGLFLRRKLQNKYNFDNL